TVLPPATPGNLLATGGDAQVTVNWGTVVGAVGYNLKRAGLSGGAYATIATAMAATNYVDANVTNGVIYYYTVSAVNSAGESTNAPVVNARPVSSAPTLLNLSANSGQLQFNWPPDHTGWRLQAQTNSAGDGLGTNWVTVPGSDGTNQMSMPVATTNSSVFYRLINQ
ncbi:MAG TPA: hypothetical protein VF988_16480, partial [Verrucomicrobiae bacterium]